MDSRTILDQMGAEQLLGHGDMLYLPPRHFRAVRVHGAFVSDQEVHRWSDHLKRQFAHRDTSTKILRVVRPEVTSRASIREPMAARRRRDPLYDQAVQIVVESRRASISGVQRRLKIGYNRAARMIEDNGAHRHRRSAADPTAIARCWRTAAESMLEALPGRVSHASMLSM